MSFENWERFVAETLQRADDDRKTRKQQGGKAADKATGGAGNDRESKGSKKSL